MLPVIVAPAIARLASELTAPPVPPISVPARRASGPTRATGPGAIRAHRHVRELCGANDLQRPALAGVAAIPSPALRAAGTGRGAARPAVPREVPGQGHALERRWSEQRHPSAVTAGPAESAGCRAPGPVRARTAAVRTAGATGARTPVATVAGDVAGHGRIDHREPTAAVDAPTLTARAVEGPDRASARAAGGGPHHAALAAGSADRIGSTPAGAAAVAADDRPADHQRGRRRDGAAPATNATRAVDGIAPGAAGTRGASGTIAGNGLTARPARAGPVVREPAVGDGQRTGCEDPHRRPRHRRLR